jgi:hypothetical protein
VLAIFRVLGAVIVDGLREIALGVEQADRDESQPLIARRLAVIAREHAEAARVDLEALVKAVLRAEVRDEGLFFTAQRRRQVGVEGAKHVAVALEVPGIGRRTVEGSLIDAAQHKPWIAAGLLPELRIQRLEQRPRGSMPAEKEIRRQLR